MNIEDAKQELIHTVQAYMRKDSRGKYKIPVIHQRPILLMGPPGIGKTAIVAQAAQACGVGYVAYTLTHHTRQSAVGLPVVTKRLFDGEEQTITAYTMSEILASVYQYMEDTGKPEGILFLDEINCVSETLVPTMLQFLQCKTFGTHKVPDGWVLAAAGNPSAYNKSARAFDIVTLDRVRCIPVEVDCPAWMKYAEQAGVHGAIVSYLTLKPQNFYYIEQQAAEKEFVTARGWEDLSAVLEQYEELEICADERLMGEFLQCEEIARDFAQYYFLYRKYESGYQIPRLLWGQMDKNSLEETARRFMHAAPDERYAVVQMLASALVTAVTAYREVEQSLFRTEEILEQLEDYRKQQTDSKLSADVILEQFSNRFADSLKVKEKHKLISAEEAAMDNELRYLTLHMAYELRSEQVGDWNFVAGRLREAARQNFGKEKQMEAEEIRLMASRAFDFLKICEGKDEKRMLAGKLALTEVCLEFFGKYSSEKLQEALESWQVYNEEQQLRCELEAFYQRQK